MLLTICAVGIGVSLWWHSAKSQPSANQTLVELGLLLEEAASPGSLLSRYRAARSAVEKYNHFVRTFRDDERAATLATGGRIGLVSRNSIYDLLAGLRAECPTERRCLYILAEEQIAKLSSAALFPEKIAEVWQVVLSEDLRSLLERTCLKPVDDFACIRAIEILGRGGGMVLAEKLARSQPREFQALAVLASVSGDARLIQELERASQEDRFMVGHLIAIAKVKAGSTGDAERILLHGKEQKHTHSSHLSGYVEIANALADYWRPRQPSKAKMAIESVVQLATGINCSFNPHLYEIALSKLSRTALSVGLEKAGSQIGEELYRCASERLREPVVLGHIGHFHYLRELYFAAASEGVRIPRAATLQFDPRELPNGDRLIWEAIAASRMNEPDRFKAIVNEELSKCSNARYCLEFVLSIGRYARLN